MKIFQNKKLVASIALVLLVPFVSYTVYAMNRPEPNRVETLTDKPVHSPVQYEYREDEPIEESTTIDKEEKTVDAVEKSTPTAQTPTYTPSPKPKTPTHDSGLSKEDEEFLKKLDAEQAALEKEIKLAKCESIQSSYDSAILSENALYQTNTSRITSEYSSRNMLHSGMYQEAMQIEGARHTSKLNTIESTYRSQLSSYGC